MTQKKGSRYSKLEAENEALRKELEMTRLERDAVNKSLNVIASRILIIIIDLYFNFWSSLSHRPYSRSVIPSKMKTSG